MIWKTIDKTNFLPNGFPTSILQINEVLSKDIKVFMKYIEENRSQIFLCLQLQNFN